MTIGKDSSFHWRAAFFEPSGITIGLNTIIGNDAFFDGRGGLSIGNNVNISGHVQIFTRDHDPASPTFATRDGKVSIHDYVYLASRTTILPGIEIGEGAVVAAGAVVSKNVEPYTIVGGIPAKKIGERTRDLTYKLKFHQPFQ
ncbi:acyltransferase [Williamsia herbipolensis]|uniref:acyltransferase n=1 Tax=Williamsia herbipolensis TaxID=1603258 RepID=UPI00193A64BA|nr:acyltransferase [Williamsia herbipolensis]